MMQIKILKPGLLSTLQDLGRTGYLSQAIPVCGAMDTLSACLANKAVGNGDNEAVIEFTYAGAAFVAETDLLIAYAGGGATLVADEQSVPRERPVFVPAGVTVKLTTDPSGSRTFLAVAGGWDAPHVLGSKSTCLTAGFGGYEGRPLKNGDTLKNTGRLSAFSYKILKSFEGAQINYPRWSIALQALLPVCRKTIRVMPAHEMGWFNAKSISAFLSAPYTIGRQSDRMGYRLDGPIIQRIKNEEMLSTAVSPGTIQVTGNGSMIILMTDCQTTGGYPRIAQVVAVDMPLCAQLKPGDAICFKEIGRREAELLYIGHKQQLRKLTAGILTKFL